MVRYEQLGEFAATILEPSTEPIGFGRPQVTVDDVAIEGFDIPGVTVLHVRLTVTDLENADRQLTVGHADLLSLEVDRIADFRKTLDLLTTGNRWDDLAPWGFSGLFRTDDDDSLFRRYPRDHLKVVTIVRDVFVDPAFRGHQLGAWMLAEVAGRPHEVTTLFVGEPRTDDDDVDDQDAYWRDVLKANQLNWRYQIAMAGSPGLRAARQSVSQSLSDRIDVSSADIRDRYDAGDRTLWPRSLVMPPLRLDQREAEYQRLRDEHITLPPSSERFKEICERLDEIRDEKKKEEEEEFQDFERRSGQNSGLDEDDEEHEDGAADRDPACSQIRVAAWNVGHRITRKAIPVEMGEALIDLGVDVIFLTEFVDGAADRDRLRDQLRTAGYHYFATSVALPRHNQIFAASRIPFEVGDVDAPTQPDSHAETNFLHLQFTGRDIELIGVRAPAYKTAAERRAYWSDLAEIMRIYDDRALVVAGDINFDPFKGASDYTAAVEFPGAEMYRATRPEGPWSFASLHDPSKTSCIDHVVHSPAVTVTDVEYRYTAGGVNLAGQNSPHKGDHAVLTFTAELR